MRSLPGLSRFVLAVGIAMILGSSTVFAETHAEAVERAVSEWNARPFAKLRSASSAGLDAGCVEWGDMTLLIDSAVDEKGLRTILGGMAEDNHCTISTLLSHVDREVHLRHGGVKNFSALIRVVCVMNGIKDLAPGVSR